MYSKPTAQDVRALADFMDVSERTARRYLANPACMPAPETKLWQLYRNGRILPESWHGVRFHNDRLVTDTDYSLQYGQVLQFAWHINCLDLLLRDLARVSRAVRALEEKGLKLQKREREKLDKLQQVERDLQQGLPELVRPAPLTHRVDGC